MSYMVKRMLAAAGLIVIYWGALFNYKEETEAVLVILGSWYIGLIMYNVVTWLIPKENTSEQKNTRT